MKAAEELRIENQRLKNQMAQEQEFQVIFNTPIPEAGGKTAKDCEANRFVIKEWVIAETETITDVRKWWTGIFKQNQALAMQEYGQIVWSPLPRSKAEIQDEENEQLIADANTFDGFARTTGLVSRSHANFLEVRRTLGPGLPNLSFAISRDVNENGRRDIFGENGESELDPPTRAELAQFAKEKQDIDQDRLKDMARRQDIAGLYARSRRDHQPPQDAKRQALNDEVIAALERDEQRERQLGYKTTPLPRHITSETIRKWNAKEMKEFMKTHGESRILSRFYNITEATNQRGQVFKFE